MINSIFPILAVILSLVFGLFYVKPQYAFVQERLANIAELTSIASRDSEIKDRIGKIEETLSIINTEDRKRFATFLPEAADPIRFANNLQHLGLAHNVIFENIKVEDPVGVQEKDASRSGIIQGVINVFSVGGADNSALSATNAPKEQGDSLGKKYVSTKASFSFVSTYEKFAGVKYSIEKSLGLIKILSLSVTPVETQGVEGKLKTTEQLPPLYRFEFSVETYSLK